MIVADTSALMAIIAQEERALECGHAIAAADVVAVSAATVVELAFVSYGRGLSDTASRFLKTYDFEIVPVTDATAEIAVSAFRAWGKGIHPARLNFGDCFSYALAKELNCPLLFIGNDFSRTDIVSAL